MSETEGSNARIILPRKLRRPIRVRITDSGTGSRHEYQAETPLRVGYGKDCDVHLEGTGGPDTLFEFSPVEGPTRLSTPVRVNELRERVEVSVDGQPYEGTVRELRSGARVQIHDRANDRRLDLFVDEPPSWLRRWRWLVAVITLALLAGIGYSFYVYRSLGDTQARISQAESRLTVAESSTRLIDQRLSQFVARMKSNQLATRVALDEIESLQAQSQAQLTADFSHQLGQISHQSEQALARLAREDTEGREKLADLTVQRVERLRQEISERLLHGMQQYRRLEEQVLNQHAQRLESLEIDSARFQTMLPKASEAVLYVRTRFAATFLATGESKPFESSGTAFLVAGNGVAVAPLHVLEPWRFDDEFLAMRELGLIELVDDSVQRHVWLARDQVTDPEDPQVYLTDNAFSDARGARELVVLHRPHLETATKMVPTPLGMAEIQSPLPGPTDLAVFQLIDFSREFSHLSLARASDSLQALDEVLVVGFPLGRLATGRSVAQGVMGSVRRVGPDLLEVDARLHPGISGSPVLNGEGRVVGMAVAIFGTVSYGVSVPARHIEIGVSKATTWILDREKAMLAAGCEPGPVDGLLDQKSWHAINDPSCRVP